MLTWAVAGEAVAYLKQQHRCPRPQGEVYRSDVTWGFLSTMEVGLQPWKIKVGVEACATTFKLI